ncbi:MAG: hypothetical protein KAR11_07010 [Phycisphaerae bacterium]|nr:hypothetical protein [Phycisphaerae bacterium]
MVTDEIIGLFGKNNQEKEVPENSEKSNWAIRIGLRADNILPGRAISDSAEFFGNSSDAEIDLSNAVANAAE